MTPFHCDGFCNGGQNVERDFSFNKKKTKKDISYCFQAIQSFLNYRNKLENPKSIIQLVYIKT